MSIESILAVTPDMLQYGVAGGFALLVIDRAFTLIKPLVTRNGRNGRDETGRLLATIVERVDGLRDDLKELKEQLLLNWGKYDTLKEDMTECKVELKMWKRECPARSGQRKTGD